MNSVENSPEPKAEGIPPMWKRIVAAPTQLEMAIVYVWLGSFLILGTDATLPLAFQDSNGASPAFILSLAWMVMPTLFLLAILVRVILIAVLKLADVAKEKSRRWLELAFVVALAVVLLGTNLGLMLRVRLSESALREHIAEAGRWRPDMRSTSYRVGLFTVHDTSIKDGVVWLETVRYGIPWAGGLVYCTDKSPPQRGEDDYQHLYGPWWRWRYDI